MPQDVFDEIEAPASSDVFDEIAPEKKDVFDEIEGGKPVVREVQPGSIPPTDLFPAIRKIGGEIVPGQIGDTHPDIIRREGIAATDIDQRGFTTPWGDFLDREAAAQGTQLPTAFEPGRLHSTDLSKFQEGLGRPLEEAAAAEAPQPFVKLPEPSARPSPIAYAPVKAVFGQKGVDVTKSVFDTVYNTAKSVPEFLQTEEGMLAMLASATPLGRAGVEAYFTGDMVKSLWDQAKSGVKDWDSLSAAQKASRITQAIATLGFTGFLARAGIGTIKQAIKKPASLLAPTVPQPTSKPEVELPGAEDMTQRPAPEVAPEPAPVAKTPEELQAVLDKAKVPAEIQAPADIAKELGGVAQEPFGNFDRYEFPPDEPGKPRAQVAVPKGSPIEVVREKLQDARDRFKEEPIAPIPTVPIPDFSPGTHRVIHGGTGRFSKGKPIWFTKGTENAEWYAGERGGESPQLVEADVTINKPASQNDVLDAAKSVNATSSDIKKYSGYHGENTLDYVYVPKVVAELKRRGFDGIIASDPLENTEVMAYVPFDISQVKELSRKTGKRTPGRGDFEYTEVSKSIPSDTPKPEVATLSTGEAKNHLGDPLGTTYRATPEDWAAWQALQGKKLTEEGVFAERERIKNKYGGMPPEPPAAPTPVEPAPAPVAQEPSLKPPTERLLIKPRTDGLVSLEDTNGNRISTHKTVEEAAKTASDLGYGIAPGSPLKPQKTIAPTIVGLGAAEKGEPAPKRQTAQDALYEFRQLGQEDSNLIRERSDLAARMMSDKNATTRAGKKRYSESKKRWDEISQRRIEIEKRRQEVKFLAQQAVAPGQTQGPAAMIGLGAAEKGEPAPGTQIEQLTQALKGVQEKRAPLVEQVKDAFSVGDRLSAAQDTVGKALSGMKAAGDMIISKWKGIPKIDDLLRAKKTLSRAIESRGWRLLKWEQQAKKSVPNPRDQAAIAKWIDAGGDRATLEKGLTEAPDKFKQAYQDALNLSGDKLTTAQNVQNYFEARLQEAIDAGVLDHGIDNYIHRMYESKPDILKRAIAYTQTGLLKTNPALAKKRFFQFDWEAEKAGYTPVQSFIKRITAYEASLSKAIAAREFIKSASEMKASDGRPVIDIKGVGIPIEDPAGVYREATLIKPKFNPARNNEPTLPNGNPNPNYRGDYVNRDYRALSRWKWVGSDAGGKPIYIQGDVAIHPEYAGRVDKLLKPSQVRYGPYGHILRPALGVSSTIKQTMLDLSGFHPVQIAVHGMEHRVMPWSVIKDIDLSHPDVEGLLQGGVTLGGDYTGLHSEGLIGSSLTRRIPGLGPVMESYHQWLFQDFIPRIKMTMALHALERNRARYAGKLTEEQIFHKTASEANAAFGELNYTVLERSKTAQDMARLILLAPDFLEARARFAGQAFQRGGKAFGHEQRTALLLGALTMWVTARIANKMIDGQYHNEPENLFNIVKDGHAYGMRTVQGDLLHLLTKPMQFAMSRLNPVYARTLLEALTGRDYFGRKRTPAEQVWDAASTTIPISLRSNRERKLWESMLNGIGVTARRYSDVDDAFKLAQKWKDKNAVPERGEFIYDPNKDVLRPLKLALNHGDEVTAAKEIKALIDSKVYNLKKLDEYFKRFASMPFTGSKANDSKFIKTLTEDQRKTVEAARQHKNEIRKLYMKSRGQYLAPPSQL